MFEPDPLLEGEGATWTIYGTKALKLELERQATLDGWKKVSPYTVKLLLLGLRTREKQRAAAAKAKK